MKSSAIERFLKYNNKEPRSHWSGREAIYVCVREKTQNLVVLDPVYNRSDGVLEGAAYDEYCGGEYSKIMIDAEHIAFLSTFELKDARVSR